MSKDLLKEAIADAKAVREAALANAKMALEESMTPKLQSMIAAKLQEMELEEDLGESELTEEDVEEGFDTESFGWDKEDTTVGGSNALDESDELEEDFDLSEILAELGDEYNNEYEELEEAKKKDKEEKKEKKEKEEEDEESESEEKSEKSEEDLPKDIDDLKNLIRDLIQQEMGSSEDTMAPGTDEVGDTVDMGTPDMSTSDMDVTDMGAPDMSASDMDSLDAETPKRKKDEDEEVNLEELLAELDALEEKKNAPAKEKEKTKEKEKEKTKKPSTRPDTTPAKMEEALKAIDTLRNELNEVNLLNAKLIYVNRIFKAKNLTEAQKVEVLASFDKATTIKEAKMLFESLSVTLAAASPKKAIRESLGFASKAVGVAPVKATIVESNDVIARMQRLANIK